MFAKYAIEESFKLMHLIRNWFSPHFKNFFFILELNDFVTAQTAVVFPESGSTLQVSYTAI